MNFYTLKKGQSISLIVKDENGDRMSIPNFPILFRGEFDIYYSEDNVKGKRIPTSTIIFKSNN